MADQDFAIISAGEPNLLRRVELIVVDGHRRLYESRRKQWSEAIAYHWLHYEDPMPVERLAEAVRKLLRSRIKLDPDAVDKTCVEARRMGYPN